ncbi:MAG: hypothetical protein IEMM0008_1394 [bacterium]|nr:MAG: hypothetical protein IEMM0008_1394 [bacterium]
MEIIETLQITKDKTLKYFDLQDDKKLSSRYGPGKWTVKEILHHLRDTETVLYERIRRIITQPKSVLWAFNPDDWCNHLGYKDLSLSIAKNVYSSCRDAVIELVKNHYQQNGHLEFIHSVTGLRTLKDEMDKIAYHNESHLKQIEKALEGY